MNRIRRSWLAKQQRMNRLMFTQIPNWRPILVLDLAFPSKKGNTTETKEWVSFQEPAEGSGAFWTIQVACVHYGMGQGQTKLPKVLRFIVESLLYLRSLDADLRRLQLKKETGVGNKCVYKEFCYYLRQDEGSNAWGYRVLEDDQRKIPDEVLRENLGEPYSSWTVETEPFGIKILSNKKRQHCRITLDSTSVIRRKSNSLDGYIFPRRARDEGNLPYTRATQCSPFLNFV